MAALRRFLYSVKYLLLTVRKGWLTRERPSDDQERLVDNWESPVTSRIDWSVWRVDFAGGLCRHEKRSGTPMGLLSFGGGSRLLSRGVYSQGFTIYESVRSDCWT